MIDELDIAIIEKLSENCRRPTTQIAQELERSTPTVRDRINSLEQRGIIQEYRAIIDVTKIGLPIKVIVQINTSEKPVDPDVFIEALAMIPEVTSVEFITGNYEALVTLRLRDIDHLSHILYKDLRQVPGVVGTNTSIVLREHRWHAPHQIGSLPIKTEFVPCQNM